MWRTSQGVGSRGRNPVLALVAGVLVLAGCSGDTAENSNRQVPTPPIQAALGDVLPGNAGYWNLIGDLSSSLTINGAIWTWPVPFNVGTGQINPFLSIQNNGTEEGFNTDATPLPLDDKRSEFTNALPLNTVPVIKVGGIAYREFILDANEANSGVDARFSIDLFDVWLCNDTDAKTFDAVADFEGVSAPCVKIYNIVNGAINTGLATDEVTSGSGLDLDYHILIPEANFAGAVLPGGGSVASCPYNPLQNPDCGIYLIFHLKLGFLSVTPVDDDNWATGATFEEMSTIKRPFVTVTKTAVPSFTRRYLWQIQKSVNPTSIVLFEGQSQNADWTITVTPQDPAFVDSDAQVNGTITIHNPSGDDVSIVSVADAIPGYPGITPSCGVSFPHTLANNGDLVCTYTVAAPSTAAGDHTNTATVTIDAGADVEGSVFTADATFNFGSVTPTEIDKNPPIKDNYNGGGEVTLGNAPHAPFVITRSYTCDGDEGTFSNVARVDITNPPVDPSATATLTVDCLDVTVAKTAPTALQRTYLWLIDKSVTPATWELFKGDQGTSAYTVTVTPNGVTDAQFTVTGVITITGDPNAPVYLQSLADAIDGSGGPFAPAPFDCEDNAVDIAGGLTFPYTLLAGHVITCDYTQALPNGDTRTNTATVGAKPTPAGTSKNFSGQASVSFASPTLTEVNKTVNVDDTYAGGPQDALVTDLVSPTVFNYNRTFACDADAGTHNNTATITETGQSDNASVTVVCRIVVVQKNAITSFDRDFNWDIDKQANTAGPLLLAPGQTFNVDYTIVVTKSAAINSNWHVTGTIRIAHNNTTLGALLNSLSDVVSPALAATITGCNVAGAPFTFPGTLAVGAQLRCTYDRDLPDGTSRTNTATAVQQNHSYSSALVATPTGTTNWASGAVAVTFGAPTNVTDNCALVDDTFSGGPQDDSICASKTYNYTRAVTAPEGSCTDFTVDNTATVTPDDDPPESDNISIPVDVQCPTGCTLTLGYWKTHNESFPGGAPIDATWELLGALKEATGFFTTTNSYPTTGPNSWPSFSWFNVFWTSPAGNAYYQLSQQYMAAKLNILNGADPTAVATAIADAEALFGDPAPAYTPAQIGALKGNDPLRQQFITLAGILGSYNQGAIGPGHCSEDGTSLLNR